MAAPARLRLRLPSPPPLAMPHGRGDPQWPQPSGATRLWPELTPGPPPRPQVPGESRPARKGARAGAPGTESADLAGPAKGCALGLPPSRSESESEAASQTPSEPPSPLPCPACPAQPGCPRLPAGWRSHLVPRPGRGECGGLEAACPPAGAVPGPTAFPGGLRSRIRGQGVPWRPAQPPGPDQTETQGQQGWETAGQVWSKVTLSQAARCEV